MRIYCLEEVEASWPWIEADRCRVEGVDGATADAREAAMILLNEV